MFFNYCIFAFYILKYMTSDNSRKSAQVQQYDKSDTVT